MTCDPKPDNRNLISWLAWDPAAFERAVVTDRPIFLNISTDWCQSCRTMDETAFSDPSVIRLLADDLVPVRVDGDRYPHVQDRYVAGGWPTNAFLTPTGEVLWASTSIEAEPLLGAASSVLAAWQQRRAEFQEEIVRRRRALESSHSHERAVGLVRREAADDVLTATRDAFDPRNGGFGAAPKFPAPLAVKLLYRQGRRDPACTEMADRTLDGMVAGELFDRADGGFYRYALAEDWTSPRFEKLLDVNAALLDAFAFGTELRGRADWREAAERTVAWVDRTLLQPDGLWSGSQSPDATYFALDAAARRRRDPPPANRTVYTSWNAQWITALANAGRRLGRGDWRERARASLATLLDTMAAPVGPLFHYRAPDSPPELPLLLADSLYAGTACLAVADSAPGENGADDWTERATGLATTIEHAFWAEEGGFNDRVPSDHDLGALRYRDRPFELNADAARFLLDLGRVTRVQKYRALAERTLALLSPKAGRYGVDGAAFALAVGQFFRT